MLLNCFLAPEDMQVGQGLLKHEIPWFLGLVFDTGLSVTPLMGHLGSLASHWSVPVNVTLHGCVCLSQISKQDAGNFFPAFLGENCLGLFMLQHS